MKRQKATRSGLRRPVLTALTVLAAGGGLGASDCATSGPEPLVSWADHDNTRADTIDHAEWQAILDGYLRTDDPSGIHLFDYGGLRANPGDRARLQNYLAHLEAVDPRLHSRDEQMAYWINFYNALTIETVVAEYPVDSIKKIHEGIVPLSGPWGDKRATVAGQRLSLDNMEHDILRALWRDPRIHYAVNCASIGCPNLAPTVFTAANLEAMMDAAARGYINHPRGAAFADEMSGVVSSIYTWFQEDFGGSEAGVAEHLLLYAEPELADQLLSFEGGFDYEYDWDLNDAR